jgi:hypothetical protein
MKPPPAYYDLVALWGLSRYQKRVLWGALCRSKWSVPVAWRARLSAGQEQDRDILCAPEVILYVLEALKGERQLSRGDVAQMEERVLGAMDSQGRWREHGIPVDRD